MAISVSYESECVGCETCVGCGRRYRKYAELEDLTCDLCGDSVEKLYVAEGKQVCASCVLKDYDEINEDNFEDYLER